MNASNSRNLLAKYNTGYTRIYESMIESPSKNEKIPPQKKFIQNLTTASSSSTCNANDMIP